MRAFLTGRPAGVTPAARGLPVVYVFSLVGLLAQRLCVFGRERQGGRGQGRDRGRLI